MTVLDLPRYLYILVILLTAAWFSQRSCRPCIQPSMKSSPWLCHILWFVQCNCSWSICYVNPSHNPRFILDGLSIEICWIPAHVRVHSSEQADMVSKETGSLPITATLLPVEDWVRTTIFFFTKTDNNCGLLNHSLTNLGKSNRLSPLGSVQYIKSAILKSFWLVYESVIPGSHMNHMSPNRPPPVCINCVPNFQLSIS